MEFGFNCVQIGQWQQKSSAVAPAPSIWKSVVVRLSHSVPTSAHSNCLVIASCAFTSAYVPLDAMTCDYLRLLSLPYVRMTPYKRLISVYYKDITSVGCTQKCPVKLLYNVHIWYSHFRLRLTTRNSRRTLYRLDCRVTPACLRVGHYSRVAELLIVTIATCLIQLIQLVLTVCGVL